MCHLPNIARCPLYIESHVGRGFGCVDDMLERCRVDRGEISFEGAVLDLAGRGIVHPGMIEALNCSNGKAA